MAENLKVTHYRNGDAITHIMDYNTYNEDWGSCVEGAYGVNDNDPANADIYGNHYNWAVINDNREVCPIGWHVPSDDEFKELEIFLGMSEESVNMTGYRGTNEGGKMKSTGTIEGGDGLWSAPNEGATNESGFTGLPAGDRHYNSGVYVSMDYNGFFWSSTEYSSSRAWYRVLSYSNSKVARVNWYKSTGFSIRCLQDEITAGCTDPEACNYDADAEMDDGSCEYPQTYCIDPDEDGLGSCPEGLDFENWCIEDVCEHPGSNYVVVNEDNQCDPNPDCPGDLDDCGVCQGQNFCINGTLNVQGGTCTCPDDWDWVVNGPCWESSGPDSGFDCRGQCLGGWVVDPCNMGDDDYIDIGWRCTATVNVHKEWCYADRDRDGNGCDPIEILNNPCIPILMCPGYNAITDPESEWPYENQCPCPTPDDLETECWSLTHTDESDWCDQWSDGCGHCVDTGDTSYIGCDGQCITDYYGKKLDDCGVCMEMQCCDVHHDDTCIGTYDESTGSWLLGNNKWINPGNNPCSDIFGCDGDHCWIPSNSNWNLSCADCSGYVEGHPNVTTEFGEYTPNQYDHSGLQSDQHCCKISAMDQCGVCGGIYSETDYQLFPDWDNDGEAWGEIYSWCGYSITSGGYPASPKGLGFESNICVEYDEFNGCTSSEIHDCESMDDYWNPTPGEDVISCCCHWLDSSCSSFNECVVVPGNSPTHRARYDFAENTLAIVKYLPYNSCDAVTAAADCPDPLTQNLDCCEDDILPSCPYPKTLDCTETCTCDGEWSTEQEHNAICEAQYDGCGICNGGDNTSCQQLGDINGDGSLDVLDVVIMINIVLEDGYDEIGDMNSDGVINILDIVTLVYIIVNS